MSNNKKVNEKQLQLPQNLSLTLPDQLSQGQTNREAKQPHEDAYDSQEISDEDFEDEEHQKILEKKKQETQRSLERKIVSNAIEFKEQNNIDWFYFENRMRKQLYDMIEPISQNLKKYSKQFQKVLEKQDSLKENLNEQDVSIRQLKIFTSDFEALKQSFRDIEQKRYTQEMLAEARYQSYQTEKYTFNQKLVLQDNQQRLLERQIEDFLIQQKGFTKVILDIKEQTNQNVQKHVTDVVNKHKECIDQIQILEEKLMKFVFESNTHKSQIEDNSQSLQELKAKMTTQMQQLELNVEEKIEDISQIKFKEQQNLIETNLDIIMSVKQSISETENYIEKYLPFNIKAQLFEVLNECIEDPQTFNNVIDLQYETRRKFLKQVSELHEKLYSLNKRHYQIMDIPEKKKIVVQEFYSPPKNPDLSTALQIQDETGQHQRGKSEDPYQIDFKMDLDNNQLKKRMTLGNQQFKQRNFSVNMPNQMSEKEIYYGQNQGQRGNGNQQNLDNSNSQRILNRLQQPSDLVSVEEKIEYKVQKNKEHEKSSQESDDEEFRIQQQEILVSKIEQANEKQREYVAQSIEIVKNDVMQRVSQDLDIIKNQIIGIKIEVQENKQFTTTNQTQEIELIELENISKGLNSQIMLLSQKLTSQIQGISTTQWNQDKQIKELNTAIKLMKDSSTISRVAPVMQTQQKEEKFEAKDESKLANAIARMSKFVQSQIDELKRESNMYQHQMKEAINKVQTFDKDVKLVSSQLRMLGKDVKKNFEKTQEEVLNIEILVENTKSQLKSEQQHFQEHIDQHQIMLRHQLDLDLKGQLDIVAQMIEDAIQNALPGYNLLIMQQVNQIIEKTKENIGAQIKDQQEYNDMKFDSQFSMIQEVEQKVLKENQQRQDDAIYTQKIIEREVGDLNQVILASFRKKNKDKSDFMLEVDNLQRQFLKQQVKIKQGLLQQEMISELYHFIKLMEFEIVKIKQQSFSNQSNFQLTQAKQVGNSQDTLNSSISQLHNQDTILKGSLSDTMIQNSQQLQQAFDYLSLKTQQIKDKVKSNLQSRLTCYTQKHDIDVDIQYIIEQYQQLLSEQDMLVKIQHMKQSKVELASDESSLNLNNTSPLSKNNTQKIVKINGGQNSLQNTQVKPLETGKKKVITKFEYYLQESQRSDKRELSKQNLSVMSKVSNNSLTAQGSVKDPYNQMETSQKFIQILDLSTHKKKRSQIKMSASPLPLNTTQLVPVTAAVAQIKSRNRQSEKQMMPINNRTEIISKKLPMIEDRYSSINNYNQANDKPYSSLLQQTNSVNGLEHRSNSNNSKKVLVLRFANYAGGGTTNQNKNSTVSSISTVGDPHLNLSSIQHPTISTLTNSSQEQQYR